MTSPVTCDSPIFIIGSPRSGTSILAWSLAQHSMLTTFDETNMFRELFGGNRLDEVYARASARPDSGDWLRRSDVSADEFVASIGLGVNTLVTNRSEGKRWIEQTPANTLIAPTLARAFRGAKFIHILRDGRAVVNSMLNFAAAFTPEAREKFEQAGAMPSFASDFNSACATWAQYVRAAEDFTASHPDRALTVRNEALREDPASGFEEIFSFLGVEPEPAAPTYFRDKKLNSSFPDARLPGGRDTPWENWTREQQDTFDRIVGGERTPKAGSLDRSNGMKAPEESVSPVLQLLEAAKNAIRIGATIAVAGRSPTAERELPWNFLPWERPSDSAVAIVTLERDRRNGAAFFALPASADQWLEELPLFADHCRGRYVLVHESDLGTVFDLWPPVEARPTQTAPGPSHEQDVTAGGEVRPYESFVPPTDEALDTIDALAVPLAELVRGGTYSGEEFRRFEQRGVHVTPVHFYSPIPDTSQLSDSTWAHTSELVGIDMRDEKQLQLLEDVFPQFRDEYEALPTSPTDNPSQFYLGNGMFDGTDALVLYCMLRHLQPRRVIEVGSGFSTRLAAQAAVLNGSTEIVCIEPFPDDGLQKGFPGLAKLIPSRVEELSLDVFAELREHDVLFIDSSHVVRTGGDVNFLFLEVLPRLRPGVVVHVHDIFLPGEYRRDWVVDGLRFWNEQYLLQAFLTFNTAFSVLLANNYLSARHPEALRKTFPTSPWWGGGSFWMQRREDV